MATIGRNAPCPCGSGKKYKKCCNPNPQRTEWTTGQVKTTERTAPQAQTLPAHLQGETSLALTCFRSERYVITIASASGRYKILQVVFGNKDGSIYVNFPYFVNHEGLVSLVHFPGNIQLPTSLSLEPGGKVTSHLVKYSHHPTGRAHFSQDGKVLSEIRKESVPLNKAEGHIFTTMFQGLEYFEPADHVKDAGYTKKRTTLNFSFEDTEPEAIKIVGRWYRLTNLAKRIQGTVSGPAVPCETPDGKKYWAFLLGHPYDVENKDSVLMLTCEAVPKLDKDEESALTFIGGFDHPKTVNDTKVDTTFLAFSYPIQNHEELKHKLGSIDFVRRTDQNILTS